MHRSLPHGALALLVALALTAPATIPTATAATPACVGKIADDEWPTFGRDLVNSRHQELPGDIDAATVPLLQPVWSYVTGGAGTGVADLNGTPIVAGGCVYLNTAAGSVIALDSTTGEEQWRTEVALDEGTVAGLGGTFVSSPVVTDDLVIGLVNQTGAPYAIALSRGKGEVMWRSDPLVTGDGYYTNATPVVFDGLVLAGFSPAEGDPSGVGGIALLDVATGQLVATAAAIPADAVAEGHAGAGIWTSPAVDVGTGYAYLASGNPFSKKIEHANTNAVLKVDVDRSRDTFASVVGALKGNVDQLDPAFRDGVDPICDALGEDPNLQLTLGNSAPCLQLDLDFGAAPNLFPSADGSELLVGDLQKSGVYHVGAADSMEPRFQVLMGASCAACNAAATAWDRDGSIYGVGTPGGQMVAFDAGGAHRWVMPVLDGAHYQSTSSAGGVVFTVDGHGSLLAFDAATGVPLLHRPLLADLPPGTQPPAGVSSSGVAIASGRVYVAAGNAVVAYAP